MHIERRMVYKHLNHIVKIFGFCPALIILSKITGQDYQPEWFPLQLILGIEAGYIGFLQMSFKNWIQGKLGRKLKALQNILIVIGYILAIIIIFISVVKAIEVALQYKILILIFYGLLFIMSISDHQKSYYQIISMEDLVVSTIIYIIAISCTKISYLGFMYILIFGLYIFNRNQCRIEYLLEQTKANTPMARNIKRDNVKWVCILMSLIFLAYPLRKRVATGVSFAFSWIGKGFLAIIKGIIDFSNWLLGSDDPITQQPVAIKQMDLEPMEQGDGNWDKILYAFLFSLLIIIIIRKRKQIVLASKNAINKIQRLLIGLYEKLFGKDLMDKVSVSNEYYMETIENIDAEMMQKVTKQKEMDKRRWHHQVKKYLKQLSSDSSYRKGYELVLQGATLKGISIGRSKTPREILEIMKKELAIGQLSEGTYIYEKTRYGEQMTTKEEVEIIAAILKELLIQ